MKQFILNKEPDKNGIVQLDGSDYRYLIRVRRLAVGEFFPVILLNGKETLMQITSITNNVLTGKCSIPNDPSENTGEIIPPIILFQALPKGDKMDLIVRQAAEGGIAEIVPFVSEFSIAKTKIDGAKFTRWERIIKEARQQSGSKTATTLHRLMRISEIFEYWSKIKDEKTTGLLFHHCQGGLEQKSLHGYLNSNPKAVVIAIGPEGGFSETEVSVFLENGFKPITIGNTVLRTETAALYCAAAIRVILLERNTWELKQTNQKKNLSE